MTKELEMKRSEDGAFVPTGRVSERSATPPPETPKLTPHQIRDALMGRRVRPAGVTVEELRAMFDAKLHGRR